MKQMAGSDRVLPVSDMWPLTNCSCGCLAPLSLPFTPSLRSGENAGGKRRLPSAPTQTVRLKRTFPAGLAALRRSPFGNSWSYYSPQH